MYYYPIDPYEHLWNYYFEREEEINEDEEEQQNDTDFDIFND